MVDLYLLDCGWFVDQVRLREIGMVFDRSPSAKVRVKALMRAGTLTSIVASRDERSAMASALLA